MAFLGKKTLTCSDKIANESMDIFSEARAKLDKGISSIKDNLAQRIERLKELEAETAELKIEIAKDEDNIAILDSKKEGLGNLI